MLSPGLGSAGPAGHLNHPPHFVIHLHSKNPKYPLRRVRAPSTQRENQILPPMPWFHPSSAFGAGLGHCCSMCRAESSIAAGGAAREPWWDRTLPSGSFCRLAVEAAGCSTTLSASWNWHSRDTWGGRDHPTKAGPDPGDGWAPSLPALGQLRHCLGVLKQNQFAASPFSSRNWAKPAETLRGEGLPSPHRAWGPGAKCQTQGAQRDSSREQESQPGSPGTSLESARKKIPEGAKGVKINKYPW